LPKRSTFDQAPGNIIFDQTDPGVKIFKNNSQPFSAFPSVDFESRMLSRNNRTKIAGDNPETSMLK